MRTLRLALRNIFRNARRTSITFLAIIAGSIGIIVFGGFVEYSFYALREGVIHTQLGHIQLYKKGYGEKGVAEPSKYLIPNPEEIEKEIMVPPYSQYIQMLSSRLSFAGLVSTGEKTIACRGIGINPEAEKSMSAAEKIIEGSALPLGSKDEGILGAELGKAMGARVGEYVTLLTNTLGGVLNAAEFKVVGIGQTGNKEYDSVFVKLPLGFVRTVLRTQSAENIVIVLKRTEDLPVVENLLKDLIARKNLDLEMKTWSDLAPFYHEVVNIYDNIFNVMKVIIGLIVFFSIANTMTMSVFERIKEIGTLRAIGTTRWGITSMFLVEGLLIGVIGGLIGMLAGIAVAQIINLSGGIATGPPPGQTIGMIIKILIVPKVLFLSFTLTVVVSVLSSVYPAVKASRLKIVDAIHYV